MRAGLILAALATALTFGVGAAEPAAAGGWDRGGTVYIHHHMFAPAQYRHIYHLHRPGARHVHYMHFGPRYARPYRCCGPRFRNARTYAGFYASPRFYAYRWRWNR